MQMAAAYSVFANGGYRVKPFLIERIVNAKGKVVWQAKPRIACHGCSRNVSLSQYASSADNGTLRHGASALRGDGARFMPPGQIAPRVISADNDYIMTSMMRSVIQFGTGVAARALGRDDIAGKTGTTNNFTNAWFNGFTPNLVAVVWTGFDDNRSLGNGEQGAAVALPIWIRYMRMALTGVPQWRRPQPPGIVRLRVSPRTGRLVSDEDPNGIEEVFMAKHLPEGASPQTRAQSSAAASIF
jgi:penicillin-binding protein 1A